MLVALALASEALGFATARAEPATPPSTTSPPVFSDATPHDGDGLTVYPGQWSGTWPMAYAYAWERCDATGTACTPLGTGQSYTVTPADVGFRLAARVDASNVAGSASATVLTAAVAAAAPANTALPTVSGIAREGATLTATTGSWSGTAPIAYDFRWKRCAADGSGCATITGAQSQTYVPTAADGGSTLRITVIARNAGGQRTATSAQTQLVATLPPISTSPPVLSGAAREGTALTTSLGGWSVTQPTAYAYQWLRCDAAGGGCVAIAGATRPSHTLESGDAGSKLRARVTATNAGGATASTSGPSALVAPVGATLFATGFAGGDGLVTNSYASLYPEAPGVAVSPEWELTGGSLYRRAGRGWTGVPDGVNPDATSSNGTGSAIFRLHTRQSGFGDVAVSFLLRVNALSSTSRTPATAWDGAHVWLRYQSGAALYAVSVERRDGIVVIKKKCPGGTTNGGTYYNLTPYVPVSLDFTTWRRVQATVDTRADGSVSLGLYVDGELVLSALDTGTGCAPISGTGAVGIRGDNAELELDDVTVTRL